jgi:hypothetical protein
MKQNKRRKRSLLPQERISYEMDTVRANDELGVIVNSPLNFDVMYALIESLFNEQGIEFDEETDYFHEEVIITNGCVKNIILSPEQHKIRITDETRQYVITASFTSLCGLIKGNIPYKRSDD